MIIGTIRPEEARVFDNMAGYHQFEDETGAPYGSFKVFWNDSDIPCYGGEPRNYDEDGEPVKPGWYWWSCWPGCLPESSASGPFARSSQAYDDAMEFAEI